MENEIPMTNVISSTLRIEIAKKIVYLHLRMENRKSPNIHTSSHLIISFNGRTLYTSNFENYFWMKSNMCDNFFDDS